MKCCYAARGNRVIVAISDLGDGVHSNASLPANKGVRIDAKIFLNISRRVVSPACIAGVRISRPNFRGPCGRMKL